MVNDCYLQVKLNNNKNEIEITVINSTHLKSSLNYNFDSNDITKVKAGRDSSCEIKIDWNKSYSKFQCSFIWDSNLSLWTIVDGKDNLTSRNGTWLFLNKSYELISDSFIRINDSKLKIKLENFID